MDNRPSALTLAITGCVLVFVGGVGLWATQSTDPLTVRIATAVASLVWGIPIIIGAITLAGWGVACVPTLVRAYDWLEARRNPAPNVTKSVTNETETKTAQTREEAARAFWIEACKVWKATGNLGWRRGFQNFLSKDSDWSEWIKEPFCPKFAIKTSTGNGWTVIARDGITPDYVAGWLAGGNLLPLPPEGWPPTWRKPQTADTKDSPIQGEYTPDTADASTVYASEARK